MIGIDLFAGAGGMSCGATAAGIRVALAIEADRDAAATYAHNHRKTSVLAKRIERVGKDAFSQVSRGREGTIVFGGPPCQGFSYSNQRTRRLDNPNNWLFKEFLRVVKSWHPDWVVFENVRGITDTEGGVFLTQVVEGLEAHGYAVAHGVLNAIDFGVPQNRSRLFVVGRRGKIPPRLPTAPETARVTVADAIGDLPKLANGASVSRLPYRRTPRSAYAAKLRGRLAQSGNHIVTRNAEHIVKRYAFIPQGGNWEDIPARLMRNYRDRMGCHTGIYHRLAANRPSIVIGNYRKNMLIHPFEDRGLSVREAARIQSFPDNYEFQGSIGFQQQQVGNAVPPKLAEAVFAEIVKQHGERR
jgi:DNA (cytosine-5)-methyltransferase 1